MGIAEELENLCYVTAQDYLFIRLYLIMVCWSDMSSDPLVYDRNEVVFQSKGVGRGVR